MWVFNKEKKKKDYSEEFEALSCIDVRLQSFQYVGDLALNFELKFSCSLRTWVASAGVKGEGCCHWAPPGLPERRHHFHLEAGVLRCDCWAAISHQPNSWVRRCSFLGSGQSDNPLLAVYPVASSASSQPWLPACLQVPPLGALGAFPLGMPQPGDGFYRTGQALETKWPSIKHLDI